MYSATGEVQELPSSTLAQTCRRFSLEEIQSATSDFNDILLIGEGGFGKVYKGRFYNEEPGLVLAIKRLDSRSNQGETEFKTEIEMLSMLRHCHIVSLVGYCDDNKEMILVYKYMPRRTLYHHLHKAKTSLNWVQRMKIAIGARRGLDYLHTGVGIQHGIIHRDVKSSNILLDENWAAMISDFGLSKLGPTNQLSSYVDASVKGTFGYLDPEYFYTRRLTRKTDVFAFGVVLFELLSGRLPVDIRYGEDQCSLVRWSQKCVRERKLDQLVDSNIKGTIFPKCLRGFAQIADRCLHSIPKERPTMTVVVASLQALLELQIKCDVSAKSSGLSGFSWMIPKYLVSASKQNSDQSGTSSPKRLENNKDECSTPDEDGNDTGEMPDHCWEILAGDLIHFTYGELKRVTEDFGDHRCLGKGRYGEVYEGWVEKMTYAPSKHGAGLPIAITRLNVVEYAHLVKKRPDLEILKKFIHPNLVKLIGYCWEGGHVLLVYEFMSRGNLENLLSSGNVAQLPITTKVKILVGIARAIVHLKKIHYGVNDYPLDRHQILLDENFMVKLSGYDVTMLVYGCYYYRVEDDMDPFYYYPGYEPVLLQTNFSGYRVVFAEVLTGECIPNGSTFSAINSLFLKKRKESLDVVAKSCFEICNETDSELKMLKILKEYDRLIKRKLKYPSLYR